MHTHQMSSRCKLQLSNRRKYRHLTVDFHVTLDVHVFPPHIFHITLSSIYGTCSTTEFSFIYRALPGIEYKFWSALMNAYQNAQFVKRTKNTYIKKSMNGMQIQIPLDKSTGRIISAFPIYQYEDIHLRNLALNFVKDLLIYYRLAYQKKFLKLVIC